MPQQSENNTNLFVLRVFRYMISKKERILPLCLPLFSFDGR